MAGYNTCFHLPAHFHTHTPYTHTHIITHLQARKSSQAIFRGSTRHRAQRRTSAARLMTTVALSYAGAPLAGYYGSTVTMRAVSDSSQQPQDKCSVSERSLLTGFLVRADRMTEKISSTKQAIALNSFLKQRESPFLIHCEWKDTRAWQAPSRAPSDMNRCKIKKKNKHAFKSNKSPKSVDF